MAHSVQSVPRGDEALYLPMLHSLQSDTEVPEAPSMYFPAAQSIQSPAAVDPAAVYVPAAQDIQLPELDESKMINDQQYNIKTRKYEEYKTQRKSDSLKLTEEQERVINNNKLLQQQKSSQRINNMAQRRMKLSDYANNLNKLMLGPN